MNFSLPFEFSRLGGLRFLRYNRFAKRLRLDNRIGVFAEEKVDGLIFYVVLFFDWANYLPVLGEVDDFNALG